MTKQTTNIKFEFAKFKVIFEKINIIPKIKLFFALSHLCLINKTQTLKD